MSYSYQFVKQDGSVATLNDVDRELCERDDFPYNDKRFCPMFCYLAQHLSLIVLNKSGKCQVEKDDLEAYIATANIPPETMELAREFLCGRYTLHMTYSR